MTTRNAGRTAAYALAGALLSASAATAAPYGHVLLISVNGLHALDLANRAAAHPEGALAASPKAASPPGRRWRR